MSHCVIIIRHAVYHPCDRLCSNRAHMHDTTVHSVVHPAAVISIVLGPCTLTCTARLDCTFRCAPRSRDIECARTVHTYLHGTAVHSIVHPAPVISIVLEPLTHAGHGRALGTMCSCCYQHLHIAAMHTLKSIIATLVRGLLRVP
jgi:hypothetical protein